MQGTCWVTIRDLTLECTRGSAVEVTDGIRNTIAGCTLRNIGNLAVAITGGKANGVVGCDIYESGDGGIRISGGNRRTLVPAGNYAHNNHIQRYSRWCRTYCAAVNIQGVGNRASHNLINDAPHLAFQVAGNNHIIEFNEVHHVCLATDDAGAFYIGRNPSERGNIIRYNFWHHLGSTLGHGTAAVYLDDGICGTLIFGNVFYKAGSPGRAKFGAVFVHGGKENIIANNVFADCAQAIGVAGWGQERWSRWLTSNDPHGIPEKIYDEVE
jgi:hypothetical protein